MVSGMVSAAWCQQLAGQRGQGAGGMPAWRGGTLTLGESNTTAESDPLSGPPENRDSAPRSC